MNADPPQAGIMQAGIMKVLDGYRSAVLAKDVEAFVALYDDDVLVFDMWEQWSHQGIAAWRAMAAGWFSSLNDERVVVGFDDIRITPGKDLALASAFVTFTALSGDGAELRSMNNRLTMALKRVGEGWKIVHEHTSGPVDPATAKAIFKR